MFSSSFSALSFLPQVEMGLTWIDHDTIDNPVEEMSVGKGVAEDVEFTVETLGGAAGGTAPGPSTASAKW